MEGSWAVVIVLGSILNGCVPWCGTACIAVAPRAREILIAERMAADNMKFMELVHEDVGLGVFMMTGIE